MTLKIYTHPAGLSHDTGPGHAERPERLQVLLDLFADMGITPAIAPEAEVEWIARAHPMAYIDALMDVVPDHGVIWLDSDTVLSPHSVQAALYGAGAVCQAAQDMADKKITRAFCATRPPGHHAEPSKAMGFCLFNNIIVGALHAQTLGFQRIAIVDFDVHHGNGTDAMARLHNDIFFVSSHQWPLYPGTGGPDDQVPGRVMNIPLPAETGSEIFRSVYTERVVPALRDYAPDLLMISAGFDAHRDDPLAQMNLTEDDYRWVTAALCAVQPRVISVLEGGYNLDALKSSARAHIEELAS